MTEIFRPADLFEGKLGQALLAPPLAEVIGDENPTRIATPVKSDDSRVLSGVWEANPGLSRWKSWNVENRSTSSKVTWS